MIGQLLAAALAVSAQGVNPHLLYTASPREHGHVAVDRSPFTNNGRLRGGVNRRDGAYHFHPRSRGNHHFDRITAPNSRSLNPGLHVFTYGLRLRVKPGAEWMNHEMAVIRKGDFDTPGGDYKMEIGRTETGKVWADCVMHDLDGKGHGYVRYKAYGVTLNDGAWHTVTCARVDRHHVSITIDQLTKTTRTVALGRIKGKDALMLGCQFQSGTRKREQFVGWMDRVTITVGRA